MEIPDFVSYMMSFIKNYEYPLIHSMNPEEMADVFHLSNRCFLVSWALNLMDEQCYGKILKGREQDKTLLADLVYCQGFCTNTEKLGFFSGTLSLQEQIEIFYRMFTFIDRQRKSQKLVDVDPVTLENIYALRNKDINLFPTFGEIRTLSEEERNCKIAEVEIKIGALTTQHEKVKECTDSGKVSNIRKEYIRDIISDINENLSQFDRIVKSIGKDASSKVEPSYKIDPTSAELLGSCNKYLKVVTQYIEDLRTIKDFVIQDIQLPIDEVSPLIEILAEQIQGIGMDL